MNATDLRKQVSKIGVPKIADESGVSKTTLRSWLRNPAANMGSERHAAVVRAVERLGAPEVDSMMLGGAEFLPVPVFDIHAAAGDGALVEDSDPISYQVFASDFLSGLTRAPLRQLSVIQVMGDSMEPTFYGGDFVMVDHSVQRIDHGGLYILRLDDANIIKRCEKDYSSKAVQIISDNPRYPIQVVKSSDRLQVIGRVIWIGRALR